MSDITWGPEIAVGGVRPAWLEQPCKRVAYQRDNDSWFGPAPYYPDMWSERDIVDNKDGWNSVTAIRLPADHFAYVAIDKGFEPWGGGDAAPADWDGGDVLRDNGDITPAFGVGAWDGEPAGAIGYHKRTETLADTVTITRMTPEQCMEVFTRYTGRQIVPLNMFRELGLLPPETLAERFTRETGHEVTPGVEAALNWSGK